MEREQAAGEIYNVGEAGGLDIQSWIRELAAVVGWTGRIVLIDESCPPPSIPRQLNLDQHLDMSSSKIRHQFGYHETMSRRESLEKTVVWDREQPPEDVDRAQFDYVTEDRILGRALR